MTLTEFYDRLDAFLDCPPAPNNAHDFARIDQGGELSEEAVIKLVDMSPYHMFDENGDIIYTGITREQQ